MPLKPACAAAATRSAKGQRGAPPPPPAGPAPAPGGGGRGGGWQQGGGRARRPPPPAARQDTGQRPVGDGEVSHCRTAGSKEGENGLTMVTPPMMPRLCISSVRTLGTPFSLAAAQTRASQ